MRFPGDFLMLRISKTATFTDHFLLTDMASLWNIWITVWTAVKLELDHCVVLCHSKASCCSSVGNLMEFRTRVHYFRHQGSRLSWWLKVKKVLERAISTNFSLCPLNVYFYLCSHYAAFRVLCLFNYIIASDLSSSLISSFSFCLFLCLQNVEEKEEK